MRRNAPLADAASLNDAHARIANCLTATIALTGLLKYVALKHKTGDPQEELENIMAQMAQMFMNALEAGKKAATPQILDQFRAVATGRTSAHADAIDFAKEILIRLKTIGVNMKTMRAVTLNASVKKLPLGPSDDRLAEAMKTELVKAVERWDERSGITEVERIAKSLKLTPAETKMFGLLYEKQADGATAKELIKASGSKATGQTAIVKPLDRLKRKFESRNAKFDISKSGPRYYLETLPPDKK